MKTNLDSNIIFLIWCRLLSNWNSVVTVRTVCYVCIIKLMKNRYSEFSNIYILSLIYFSDVMKLTKIWYIWGFVGWICIKLWKLKLDRVEWMETYCLCDYHLHTRWTKLTLPKVLLVNSCSGLFPWSRIWDIFFLNYNSVPP